MVSTPVGCGGRLNKIIVVKSSECWETIIISYHYFPSILPSHVLLVNAAAITKYHRLGGLNNRHLFLTVLEAGKAKIMMPAR